MDNNNTNNCKCEVIDYICYKCVKLVCAHCFLKHHIHGVEVEDYSDYFTKIQTFFSDRKENNYISTPTSNDKNYIYNRINHVWKSMKEQIQSHEHVNLAAKNIKENFDKLRILLDTEEQKLQKPLQHKQEKIEESLKLLKKEMMSLIEITNSVVNDPFNIIINNIHIVDSKEKEDISTKELIGCIKKSETMLEYIRLDHSYLAVMQKQQQEEQNIVFGKLINHLEEFNGQLNKLPEIESYHANVNENTMDIVKELIEEKFIDVYNRIPYLFCLDSEGEITLVDLVDRKLEQPMSKDVKISDDTLNSCVCTNNDSVYVFSKSLAKFFKFEGRIKKTIVHTGNIHGIEMADSYSVCYDGKQYIYILSGYKLDALNSKLSRFDTITMQFEKLGDTGFKSYLAYIFHYENEIYIVYNTKTMTEYFNSIQRYNIMNKTYNLVLSNIHDSLRYELSVCSDDKGNVYLYNTRKFIKCNVQSTVVTELKLPFTFDFSNVDPVPSLVYPMAFHRVSSYKSYIYFITGNKHGNHIYSTETDRWNTFTFDDRSKRICSGATVFYI